MVVPIPPASPIFFVHVGALGVFKETNAENTGGGFFNFLPVPAGALGPTSAQGAIANIATRPDYTLGLEAGYFVTPNWAIALSAGVPPIAHLKATGLTLTPQLGTNELGSVRYGPAALLLQYHFTNFGAFQPYLGVGAVYVLRWKMPAAERPYRTWGYPITPAIYLLAFGGAMASMLHDKWQQTAAGSLLIIAGVVAFYAMGGGARPTLARSASEG